MDNFVSMTEANVACFQDTMSMCKNNDILSDSVKESKRRQIIFKESEGEIKLRNSINRDRNCSVHVTKERSFEAARKYISSGYVVAVLNFASAVSPGGGVVRGCTAQEECLCRVSTLYPCLEQASGQFYNEHKQMLRSGDMSNTYNGDIIYTPDVKVFKTDTSKPKVMEEFEWYTVDVITCAAPDLRTNKVFTKKEFLKSGELCNLHMERARRILNVAANNSADVVILGAFGCGAFNNPPETVAEAYRRVLPEYLDMFDHIEFAVYTSKDTRNYDVFSRVLKRVGEKR